MKNGLPHRNGDLPALERSGARYEWWVDGKRHRDHGLPAVVTVSTGTYEYWVNGQLHRDGGLPAIDRGGVKKWLVNGKLHRAGGLPAIEYTSGRREWYVNGQRHRDHGLPAVERPDVQREWWVYGSQLTEDQALLFSKMQTKRVKRLARDWYDLTYVVGKPAFNSRMKRDISALEYDIGYKFDEPLAKKLKL